MRGFASKSICTGNGINLVIFTLAIAAAYVITGRMAMFLALPPLYATAIFPPIGIAIAATFIGGPRLLGGVFVGSLLLNLWLRYSYPQFPAQIGIAGFLLFALAATLQTAVAGLLLRHKLGYPCAFDRARDITFFLLTIPICCAICSTLSVTWLFLFGELTRELAQPLWLMWWLSDTMGALVFFPVVIVIAAKPRSLWQRRKFVVIIPMLIATTFFALIYLQARRWEEWESLNFLRTQIGWQSWTVLSLGIFGTGLLGGFLMLSSGHSARVEMEVERSTKALRESEERWQFALEGAGDGVWDFDLQTSELFLSAKNMAMLGYPEKPRRMTAEEWRAFIHPIDLEQGMKIFAECVAKGNDSYAFDFRALTREGQWRWLRRRGKLFGRLPNGFPARMIGTHTDVHNEKQRELKERLHSAVMEMLAGSGKFHSILRVIKQSLQEATPELVYAFFTVRQGHLEMNAVSDFAEKLRAIKIPLEDGLQSGGAAIQDGKIIHTSVADNIFGSHLKKIAADSGYVFCWVELIYLNDEGAKAALVAFKKNSTSPVLPDIDHIKHAADLIRATIQHKLAEEQLKLITSVYEASSEGIIVADAEGHILAVNPAFTHITGYSAKDVIGRTSELFRSDQEGDRLKAIAKESLDKTGYWKGEIWGHRVDGSLFPIAVTINTIWEENGRVARRIALFSDITDKKISEERVQYLATHDALTALPNRTLFHDRLHNALALAERERDQLALLYVDLDHFKPVNDTLGHSIGDQLLKAVAVRMSACVRESDTVARMGGDEFVVLLPTIISEDAFSVAEKIARTLNEPFEIDKNLINISASIGVAIYPIHGCSETELSECADIAMYRAKQRGRNAIEIYCA